MNLTIKHRYIFVLAAAFFLTACGSGNKPPPGPDDLDLDPVSSIPFPVKAPEKFSAEVLIKSMTGKGFSERKYFIAKDGEKSFETYGVGEKDEFSLLVDGAGVTYRLNSSKKEFQRIERSPVSPASDSISKSLTSRWLNEKRDAQFIDLGRENGLRKYQIKLEGSKNTEILIFIDETLKYPVLQQFFSVIGKKKKLMMSIELRNITTSPDQKVFALPKKYTESPTEN